MLDISMDPFHNNNKSEEEQEEENIKKDPFRTLWQEVRDLTQIERLPSPPTPLAFFRSYVSQNKPCIISNAVTHWPALSLWAHTDSHLVHTLSPSSTSSVSLHLTPSGKADSLAPHPSCRDGSLCFASAQVDRVPFSCALELIYSSCPEKGFVAYAQQQNDCFREEYSALSGDCESHIPWASEALGCLPEAVNLWIGNEFSETSFHKDHYENIYAVVTGEKHFLLLPPTDVHRMYIRDYPAANYCYCKDTGEFKLKVEDPVRQVPWSSVDPYPAAQDREKEMTKFPLYFNGPKPFEVTVKAGEILYLPSMWFHYVRQSPDSKGRTIAVNYWYDMQFDIKYAYFNFLQSIPYPSCHDQKTPEKRRLQSSLDTSIVNDIEDELGTGLVVDGNSEMEGERVSSFHSVL